MNREGERVLLGARGWEWPIWESGFYPRDMPSEWRLTYYNTQFPCVFLPADRWQATAPEEMAQWSEDTHERFLFLLEGGEGMVVPEPLRGRALCLPARDESITWFDARSDLKSLAADLRQPAPGARYLLSWDGDLAQLERVRTLLELLGVPT